MYGVSTRSAKCRMRKVGLAMNDPSDTVGIPARVRPEPWETGCSAGWLPRKSPSTIPDVFTVRVSGPFSLKPRRELRALNDGAAPMSAVRAVAG